MERTISKVLGPIIHAQNGEYSIENEKGCSVASKVLSPIKGEHQKAAY